MVNKKFIKLGPCHVGKLVTVVIDNTHYRVMHGDEELAIRPRRDTLKAVIETSRPVAQVAKEVGVLEGTLGSWVSA